MQGGGNFINAGLSLGTSLISNRASKVQSRIEAQQAEVAAKAEELRLVQREADRKDRLATALAAQNALAGAKGVAAFEGSPLTILQDSIRREQTATERDKFSTELETLAIRSSSRIRTRFSDVNRRLRLIESFSGVAQTGGFGE